MALLVHIGETSKVNYTLSAINTIGRDPRNSITISDPSLSPFHAEVRRTSEKSYAIIALPGSGGVYLRGERVSNRALEDGDEIRIGSTRLAFRDDVKRLTVAENIGITVDTAPPSVLYRATLKIDEYFRPLRHLGDEGEVQRNYEKLRAAYEMSQVFVAVGDLDTLLKSAVDTAMRLLSADRATVLLIDPNDQQPKPRVARSRKGETGKIRLSSTLIKEVLANREAVILSDAATDERFRQADSIFTEGVRSAMCVPMLYGTELVGIMHLESLMATNTFTARDLDILTTIATQTAVAVKNLLLLQQFRQANAFIEKVLKTLPGILIITDAASAITRVNQAVLSTLGYEHDELIGKPLHHLFLDDSDHCSSSVVDEEIALVRRDGSRIPVSMSTSVIHGEGGKPEGLVVMARDLSEHKEMQARLAQSERMASVGLMAAGVAHEINNPLTYILYNLESLLSDMKEHRSSLSKYGSVPVGSVLAADEALERIGEALDGANRVRAIVKDLKTFSRAKEDRIVPIELNEVIESAANVALNEIKYRARLVKDLGAVPPVMANEGRLSQVFLNLLMNASQAIDEGDAQNNQIRVRTWTEGNEVLAEVSDSGKGIPPEDLARLFEPFFTTKESGSGMGLGLSICQKIITDYGGRIEVRSDLGRGTRFLVRLPLASSPGAAVSSFPRPVKESSPSFAVRGRVLIIDDEPVIGNAVKRTLQREHDVVVVTSGEEAKQLLERDDGFDVILCDLMMPKITGVDFYRWLAGRYRKLARQTVFMTGGVFTAKVQEFLEQVPNARLEKPMDKKNLMEIVRNLVIRRRGR